MTTLTQDAQKNAQYLFKTQWDDIFRADAKIGNTDRIIIALQQEQHNQNKVLFILSSLFWLSVVSIPVLFFYFVNAFTLKTTITMLTIIWVIGILWGTWVYRRLSPPRIPTGETRNMIGSIINKLPATMRPKCPAQCTPRDTPLPSRTKPDIPKENTGFATKYPTSHNYWKDGVANTIPPSGNHQPEYTCEWIGDPEQVAPDQRIITSQYPCDVIVGYETKKDEKQREIEKRLRENRKFNVYR